MNKLTTAFKICLGILLKQLTFLKRPDKNLWVLGSGKGDLYNENSKYLYEFILKSNYNINVVWITRNSEVVGMLKEKGYPVHHNYSVKGILCLIRASVYFYSTIRSDIEYYFPVNGKKIVNLFHGMPIKKIIYDYDGKDLPKTYLITQLYNKYVAGFMWEKVHLHISTSDFFNEFLKTAYRSSSENIAITGLPRNDVLFKDDFPQLSEPLKNIKDRFIISYLPTHRKFGKGKTSPMPFLENIEVKEYFKENGISLVYKTHYNENRMVEENGGDTMVEVSPKTVDTQVLLKVTDLLISDYSSCLIDFLVQDRPVIGYFYDNYKVEDTGLYFDIESENFCPGLIAKDESELFARIKQIFEKGDPVLEKRKHWIAKYHKYLDGNSSSRIVEQVQMLIS